MIRALIRLVKDWRAYHRNVAELAASGVVPDLLAAAAEAERRAIEIQTLTGADRKTVVQALSMFAGTLDDLKTAAIENPRIVHQLAAEAPTRTGGTYARP